MTSLLLHSSTTQDLYPTALSGIHQTPTPLVPQKRKIDASNREIPDSDAEDDEDYGWADDDEDDIPPPAPQWQGSEDILIVPEKEPDPDEVDSAAQESDGEPGVDHLDRRKNPGLNKSGPLEIEDSEDELAL